jgi:type IV fimbrial biogenesis protein FimT
VGCGVHADHLLDHEEGWDVLIPDPKRACMRGFTMIEIVVVLAVMAMLMALGLPAMGEFLQNTQIRNAAEATMNGMQLARGEAVRRNIQVRFQYVDTLDAACTLSASGPHWIVSRNDPTSACDQAEVIDFLEPNDTSIPQIIQKRSNADGSPNADYTALDGVAPANTVVFTSLGRMLGGAGMNRINFSNPAGTCKHSGGNLRCLSVVVSTGGDIRLCDPAVSTAGDTRKC